MEESSQDEFRNKTYTLTTETERLIRAISNYYSMNASSAIRFSIREVARRLGLEVNHQAKKENV